MKQLQKKAYTFFLFFIIFALTAIIYTLFLYLGKGNTDMETIRQTTFIIGIVLFFILGLLSGYIEQQKGILNGFISGVVFVIIIIIVRLISKDTLDLSTWIKYICYILSSCLGGLIGVHVKPFQRKKKAKRK